MQEKENVILNLTLEFALAVIVYCEILEQNRRYVICQHLLQQLKVIQKILSKIIATSRRGS
jgi:hypothetical protein